MQIKTSINLNLELRDEAKVLGGIYGAQNLSALVNGFFYYLLHHENPRNGVDIERLLHDALAGDIMKTKNQVLQARNQRRDIVFSHMDDAWGDGFLKLVRKYNKKRYLKSQSNLHEISIEIYNSHGIVILEDELLQYVDDWYEDAKCQPKFEKIELDILKDGGVVIADVSEDKKD